MNKNTLLVIVILVLVLAALTIYGPTQTTDQNLPPVITGPVSATTTITGVFECLPHRNTRGSGQTLESLECTFGMKDEGGRHHALDFSGTPVSAFDLPMDRKYKVTGLYTPIEMISTDRWNIYDIRGIMRVSQYEELQSDIPVLPADSDVTLELLKPVIVAGTTLRVTAVLEDSRCPSDAKCVQAGRALLALNIQSPSGTSNMQIQPGQTVTTETLSITLSTVSPYPVSTKKIADDEYRFQFRINSK